MELFDAVYGDAYAAAEKLLQSEKLTAKQLREILCANLTGDGAMEAGQKLKDGSWPLFRQNAQGEYERAMPPLSPRPFTRMELRWLRNLSEDERAPLFLTDEQLAVLQNALRDTPPLYEPKDIDSFDAASSGDDFADPAYREHFHILLAALREGKGLILGYTGQSGQYRIHRITPEKIEYSAKDRRFRLHGCNNRGKPMIFNAGRIAFVRIDDAASAELPPIDPLCKEPLVLQISGERNALERFMLEFSCFRKESSYDPETGTALAKVWYPQKDETEVLIRVLGFGPMIRVIEPEAFVQRIRERIEMQTEW